MELFCERARAVRPDITATDAVAKLCDRLDGLPLALELAAARTKLLTPEALLDRLTDRLDALKGTRDAEERHATLRATISWSYDLLDDAEQELFARLGVFRGGCTLETAEIVCDADLDTLASLLDKSLLRRRTGSDGEERYWMLETIREFALERLRESGSEEDLRRRHAERMLEFAGEGRIGAEYGEADVGTVLAERDDLRGALDWAEVEDPSLGLELAVELQHLWNASAPKEGLERIQRLLNRAEDIPLELRADALRVAGGSADLAGDDDLAVEMTRESVEHYRQLGDDRGIAIVEEMLAVSAWRRQDWDRVRELSQHSLELAAGRFPFIETSNYWLLGQLALNDGDLDLAVELTRRGTEMAHAAGWVWWESGQRHELLMLALLQGNLEEAEREGLVALEMERTQENRLWALYTLAGLAQVALARGDLERAGLLWGAAEAEGESLPRWPDERTRRIGALADERPAAGRRRTRTGQRDGSLGSGGDRARRGLRPSPRLLAAASKRWRQWSEQK